VTQHEAWNGGVAVHGDVAVLRSLFEPGADIIIRYQFARRYVTTYWSIVKHCFNNERETLADDT
jgi:hypothetical protein